MIRFELLESCLTLYCGLLRVHRFLRTYSDNYGKMRTCKSSITPFLMCLCGGFVPYLPNSSHVHHSQQSTRQVHNKSWRSGNLHHSAWVEGHTGGSRSIPTAHPCSQNGERLWEAPQRNKPNTHKSQAQLPQLELFMSSFSVITQGLLTNLVGNHVLARSGKCTRRPGSPSAYLFRDPCFPLGSVLLRTRF